MKVYYEIVHIKPNKQETIIAIKHKVEDLPRVTEKPQWAGTWLTPDRKLLRYGRGELVIREKVKQPRIVSHKKLTIGDKDWYELQVMYHETLHTIFLNDVVIMGHNSAQVVLWSTNSPVELAEHIGKEMSYQVSRYQEKYLADHPQQVVKPPLSLKDRIKQIVSINRNLDQ